MLCGQNEVLGAASYSVITNWGESAPKHRRIGMIRWLLVAAVAFLVIAALQSYLAGRHGKRPLEGKNILPTLPPLPDATELEKSRRELEELEQRLNIPNPGQQGKGA